MNENINYKLDKILEEIKDFKFDLKENMERKFDHLEEEIRELKRKIENIKD